MCYLLPVDILENTAKYKKENENHKQHQIQMHI